VDTSTGIRAHTSRARADKSMVEARGEKSQSKNSSPTALWEDTGVRIRGVAKQNAEGQNLVVVELPTVLTSKVSRPVHRDGLADELLHYMEAELRELPRSRQLDAHRPLWVSKTVLSGLVACEACGIAQRGDRSVWRRPGVLGVLADHALPKVLDGSLGANDAVKTVLWQLAHGQDDLARYLMGLGPASKDLLALEVIELLEDMLRAWPGYHRSSYEHQLRLRIGLMGNQVVLVGVPDMILGRLRSPSGESRAVVLDWKCGRIRKEHQFEQRFYALLVTLAAKRPPWRVATYYLREQVAIFDDVDEDLLWEITKQVTFLIKRLVEIRDGEKAGRRPGPQCHWCPARSNCTVAT